MENFSFCVQVMEVVNGDALVVKTSDGQYQKIFFSSLRPPRPSKDDSHDTLPVSEGEGGGGGEGDGGGDGDGGRRKS